MYIMYDFNMYYCMFEKGLFKAYIVICRKKYSYKRVHNRKLLELLIERYMYQLG